MCIVTCLTNDFNHFYKHSVFKPQNSCGPGCVLCSVEVHFNNTFCRVLCGKSSVSIKWYFNVAVLTLDANVYGKFPFLIFTKLGFFLNIKSIFQIKFSNIVLWLKYKLWKGTWLLKKCFVTLVQQPLFFPKRE